MTVVTEEMRIAAQAVLASYHWAVDPPILERLLVEVVRTLPADENNIRFQSMAMAIDIGRGMIHSAEKVIEEAKKIETYLAGKEEPKAGPAT